MKSKQNKVLSIVLPILSVVLILCVWIITSLVIDNKLILPKVSETMVAFVGLFSSGDFYTALLNTLLRCLIAFLVSFIIAFILAVISKRNNYFKKFISPIIAIIRALPTVAVVLLILFWTNSKVAPAVVTTLIIMPTLYTDFLNSLDVVHSTQIVMCNTFKVSRKDFLRKVEIPQIMPQLLKSVGSGFSLNIKLMVAAEVIAQTARSIGYLLNTSKIYFEIANMLAIVVIMVVIGILVELVFVHISDRVGKWK